MQNHKKVLLKLFLIILVAIAVVVLSAKNIPKQQQIFSADVVSGMAPLTVHFTNTIQTAGDISIDYGDKTNCSSSNPYRYVECDDLYTHSYTKPGTYDVVLYRHLPTMVEIARLQVKVEGKSDSAVSTKDWKTYTNSKYGFEFKYPISNGKGGVYKIGEASNNYDVKFIPTGLSSSYYSVAVSVPCNCYDPEYGPAFIVDVTGIVSPQDVYTYAKNQYSYTDQYASTGGQIEFSSSEYVTINGVQWLKANYLEHQGLSSVPNPFYFYFTAYNNNFYEMGLHGLNINDNDYKELGLYDILSTFKFTK